MALLNSQPQTRTTSWFDKTHVVAIGIDDYRNGVRSLGKAVNDAVQIAEIVEELKPSEKVNYYFSLASKSNPNHEVEQKVKRLNGNIYSPIKEDFKKLLSHLQETVGNNDRIIIYFAGHAIALPFARLTKDNGNSTGSQLQVKLDSKPQGYLLFQDAVKGDRDTYMKMDELIELLREIQCRHGLIILDCCFAGTIEWSLLRESSRQVGYDRVTPSILDRYITKNAWQILTSSSETQKTNEVLSIEYQLEKNHSGNSPFVTTLRKALIDGEADSRDSKRGFVHANKLINYLRDQVEESAIEANKLQTPCMFPFSLKHEQTAEFVFLLNGKELNEIKSNLPKDPDISQIKNPYLGLESYSRHNYHIFFGRENLIEKLLKHINENKFPLTVVLGASGSGKSSLVKAGLIGKIDKDKIETSWETFRPEKSPGSNLTDAVKKLQNNNGKKCLLVIDQFEEVETQCEDSNEKDLFWEELIKLLTEDEVKVDVVLTLRSDFEMRLRREFESAFTKFSNKEEKASDYWDSARFNVPVIMEREQLEEVITKPASKSVVFFEDNKNPNGSNERTLVEQLSSEVTGMPGALPLLSVALNSMYETFKKRYLASVNNGEPVKREITWKDYESLGGGVVGSLSKRANQVHKELVEENDDYCHTVRHLMLRMISLQGGELARRQVSKSELIYSDKPDPEKQDRVNKVIKSFDEARLIVQGSNSQGEPYVEPAHDALVQRWDKLQEWINEEQENLLLRQRLTPAANDWKKAKDENENVRAIGFLWDNNPHLPQLEQVVKSKDSWLNQKETKFIRRSIRNREEEDINEKKQIIKLFSRASQAFFASNQLLESLIEAVKAGKKLQKLRDKLQKLEKEAILEENQAVISQEIDIVKNKVVIALEQAVYEVRERNRLEGHTGPIESVCFSADGQMIASAAWDNTVKLWSRDGREINTFYQEFKTPEGYSTMVESVSFSPNSEMIAACGGNTVKLWNRGNGSLIATLIGHISNNIKCICFSPDATKLVTASSDNTVKLWNLNLLNIEEQIPITFNGHTGEVNSVSFSPDGQIIASGSFDNTVKLWNLDGTINTTLIDDSTIYDISFSHDGKKLVTASSDNTVKLWNLNLSNIEEQIPITFNGHTGEVNSVSFSPDGQTIASGSSDNTVKLWNLDGKEIITLTGHTGKVLSVNFSPDAQIIASSSYDSTVKLWNGYSQKRPTLAQKILDGGHTEITKLSFSPDGKIIAGAGNKDVKLWNLETQEIRNFINQESGVSSVSFSPIFEERMIAFGDFYGQIKVYNLIDQSLRTFHSLSRHNSVVRSLSFSPDGQMIASGSDDKTVKLWNRDGTVIKTLEEHTGGVWSVCFSPDGQIIASGSDGSDKTVKLWSLDKLKVITTLRGHQGTVNSICFSPDGQIIASAASDNTVKLWNREGQLIKTLRGHDYQVFWVTFSPDGQLIVSADWDGTVKLWDREGQLLKTLKKRSNKCSWFYSACFSPDGQTIASGTSEGVLLWNFNLDDLVERGCNWVCDYLKNNPNVEESDRHLCDDVPPTTANSNK